MKNKYYLYVLPLCAIFLFNGKKYDESVIERIHLAVSESGENLGKGHGDLGLSKEQTRFDEAPLVMLIPLCFMPSGSSISSWRN